MPAWLWITPLAAVAFVFWIGWGRGWLRSVRYSFAHAQHVIELSRAEYDAPMFYGSMSLDADQVLHHELPWWPAPTVDPEPWRAQMTAELSPEALGTLDGLPVYVPGVTGDWLSAPPDLSGDLDAIPPNRIDPGPGDAAVVPPASSGPDQCPCGKPMDHTEFCYDSAPVQPSRWLAEQLEVLRAWAERQQAYAEILS